jgi:hypothetical protein
VTSEISPQSQSAQARFPRSLGVPFAAILVTGFLADVSPAAFALAWTAVCALNCFILVRGLRGPRCDRCQSICPWRRYRCEWAGGHTEALCSRCLHGLG